MSRASISQVARRPISPWRQQAADIVSDLFRVTEPDGWDDLLDLRESLLRGINWTLLFDQFCQCRNRLEQEHYLPFYRLRRLIESSLRLSATYGCAAQEPCRQLIPLRVILQSRCRSFAQIERNISRQRFEHDLNYSWKEPLLLELAEWAPAQIEAVAE